MGDIMAFKPSNILKNGVIFLVVIMVLFGIYGAIQIQPVVDKLKFVAQLFSVLVAILMVYVIGIQAETMWHQTAILKRQADDMSIQREVIQRQTEIMKKQTEILELEKKPMLAFRKIYDFEYPYAFEITNISKFPVKIEFVEFEPPNEIQNFSKEQQQKIQRVITQAIQNYRHLLREKIILPEESTKITRTYGVIGHLRIRAYNLYYDNLVLEYTYDVGSGKFKVKDVS